MESGPRFIKLSKIFVMAFPHGHVKIAFKRPDSLAFVSQPVIAMCIDKRLNKLVVSHHTPFGVNFVSSIYSVFLLGDVPRLLYCRGLLGIAQVIVTVTYNWTRDGILETHLLPNDVILFAPVECDLPQGLRAECKPG